MAPFHDSSSLASDRALFEEMSVIAARTKTSRGTSRSPGRLRSSRSPQNRTPTSAANGHGAATDTPPGPASTATPSSSPARARPSKSLLQGSPRPRRRKARAANLCLAESILSTLSQRSPASSAPPTPRLPPPTPRLPPPPLPKVEAAILGPTRHADVRDESSPRVSPQEMESGGSGPHATMALHMPPPSPFGTYPRPVTLDARPASAEAADLNGLRQSPVVPSPARHVFRDHLRPSNLRGAGEGEGNANDDTYSLPADSGMANPDIAPLETGGAYSNLDVTASARGADVADPYMNDSFRDPDPVSAVSEMSLNPEEMKGYAQLVFPDGEYLVASTEIMLGRDERAHQILKDQAKKLRRERREQALRQARQQVAEHDAQEALEQYKLEPSHASQQGDDDAPGPSSSSSHPLEGRPAPALPSIFSEQGGIVNYEGSVDEVRRKRFRKRSLLLSRSSSNTSVAPANLHVYGTIKTPYGSSEDGGKGIFLPIHPFQPEDIRKISKEHLRIYYDPTEKQWKMEIKGNGAFVLNELYHENVVDPDSGEEDIAPRHFKRDDTVFLTHNTEVLVTSLTFHFKLPQRKGVSSFDSEDDIDEGDEDQLSASLPRRLSSAADAESMDHDDPVVKREEEHGDKKAKIKLRPGKGKSLPKDHSPEDSRRLGAKGKKPKAAAAEPSAQPESASPPADLDTTAGEGPLVVLGPPAFDPTSSLQHVPVDELPEKRKGPGRPPKNGLVSKRDEGIIRRKMKEFEKRGERPPPYKDILAQVRAENRAKELAARAAARGEPAPAVSIEMTGALPSNEIDLTTEAPIVPQQSVQPTTESPDQTALDSQEPEGKDSAKRQQQRTYKSPSPMKPREEYTAEELKRPTQTYYYILDEILAEGPEDAMELQQIYDKICKKYPFYKYIVESTGWQSSVRHNLKQNDRFLPVQKQGKGWLWAIDHTVPLDKEKKRKPTPPPMPRPPVQYPAQNGATQPGMPYAASNYVTPYGQPPSNGQAPYQPPSVPPHQGSVQQSYSSPYGQAGAPNAYGPPAGPLGQPIGRGPSSSAASPQPNAPPRTTSHPPSQRLSHTPQPAAAAGAAPQQPPAVPLAFHNLVEEIMQWRVTYLSQFGQDAATYARHERIFKRVVEWISMLQMRQNPRVEFENDEERRVFNILEGMRHKFEQRRGAVQETPVSAPGLTRPDAVPVASASTPGLASTSVAVSASTPQAQPAEAQPASTQSPANAAAAAAVGRIPSADVPPSPYVQPQPNAQPTSHAPSRPSSAGAAQAPVSAGVKRAATESVADDTDDTHEGKRAKI